MEGNQMKPKFDDYIAFRLDGNWEGEGLVLESHSHSCTVELIKHCKEYPKGSVIIVDFKEIYKIF